MQSERTFPSLWRLCNARQYNKWTYASVSTTVLLSSRRLRTGSAPFLYLISTLNCFDLSPLIKAVFESSEWHTTKKIIIYTQDRPDLVSEDTDQLFIRKPQLERLRTSIKMNQHSAIIWRIAHTDLVHTSRTFCLTALLAIVFKSVQRKLPQLVTRTAKKAGRKPQFHTRPSTSQCHWRWCQYYSGGR